jgi:hypothetical protein
MSYNSLVLLLIWPFSSLLTLFRGKFDLEFRNIFWFLCVLFGFGFVIKSDAGDGFRYAQELSILNSKISFGFSFWSQISLIYSEYSDPFNPIVTYIVALFTNDHRFLFGSYALVFGYFYANNVYIILNRLIDTKKFLLHYFLIAYIIFLLPIWEINGVRMWTGFQSLFYVLLISKKRLVDHLLIVLLPPFFHSAFFIFSIFYISTLIINKYLSVAITSYIFIFTALIVFVDFKFTFSQTAFLGDIGSVNNELLEGKTAAYNMEHEREIVAESWFLTYSKIFQRYINCFLAIFLFSIRKRKQINLFGSLELNMVYILAAIINIIALHPSISSGRFILWNTYIITFLLLVNYNYKEGFIMKFLELCVIFLVTFVLIIKIRYGFESFNYGFFLGNIFSLYFLGNDVSMLDFYYAIFGKYSS